MKIIDLNDLSKEINKGYEPIEEYDILSKNIHKGIKTISEGLSINCNMENNIIEQFRGEYRWLSNFHNCKIEFDGYTYPTAEHAFMSAKSNSIEWKEFCSDSRRTPGEVKKAGKKVELIEDWDNKKFDVMKKIQQIKYNQEPFKSLLLKTKDKHIQEGNYWNDLEWGFCLKTFKGNNRLGEIIMEVRDTLNKELKNNI